MSDASKPMAAEPQMANLSLSSETPASTSNGTASSNNNAFAPREKINWADDEEATPNTASDNTAGAKAADDSLEKAQNDGASTWMHGSVGLDEPEFDVNVKLADLQANPDNPLYSAKTFEELNL
jgi:ATP-dependent RNA helicase DDX19/DBP5